MCQRRGAASDDRTGRPPLRWYSGLRHPLQRRRNPGWPDARPPWICGPKASLRDEAAPATLAGLTAAPAARGHGTISIGRRCSAAHPALETWAGRRRSDPTAAAEEPAARMPGLDHSTTAAVTGDRITQGPPTETDRRRHDECSCRPRLGQIQTLEGVHQLLHWARQLGWQRRKWMLCPMSKNRSLILHSCPGPISPTANCHN